MKNKLFSIPDPYDEKYKNVQYIMLDPSCSGSGMLNNLFFNDKKYENLTYEDKCGKFYKNLDLEERRRA